MVTSLVHTGGPDLDFFPTYSSVIDMDMTADATRIATLSYTWVPPTARFHGYYGAAPLMTLWEWPAGGTRYSIGSQIQDPGDGANVESLRFHPSGNYLVMSCRYNTATRTGVTGQVVYQRFITATQHSTWYPAPATGIGTGRVAFDATGAWMAVAGGYSHGAANGIAAFDATTGATRWVCDAPGNPWLAVDFNPADPSVLAVVDAAACLRFFRRNGNSLTQIGSVVFAGDYANIAWHPSGQWVVASAYNFDYGSTYHNAWIPTAYAYPGGAVLHRFYQLAQATAFRFDPTGTLLAGGLCEDPDPYAGYDCANAIPVGLTVLSIAGGPTNLSTEVVLRDAGQHNAGQAVAFGVSSSGTVRLAAATTPPSWEYARLVQGSGYEVRKAGFDAWESPAAAPSTLRMRQPDGSYALVGTADRPLTVRLPDASTRTWPGAQAPLYMRQDDGTWRKVVG